MREAITAETCWQTVRVTIQLQEDTGSPQTGRSVLMSA